MSKNGGELSKRFVGPGSKRFQNHCELVRSSANWCKSVQEQDDFEIGSRRWSVPALIFSRKLNPKRTREASGQESAARCGWILFSLMKPA